MNGEQFTLTIQNGGVLSALVIIAANRYAIAVILLGPKFILVTLRFASEWTRTSAH